MSQPVEAVSASGITKTFRGGIRALDGLDFQAWFGEVAVLIGANGSGKTTLLRILFGALHPDGGSVRTLGISPASQPKSLLAKVGYVPQHLALDPEMTGRETLDLFCTLYGLTGVERRQRVAALVESMGLAEVVFRRVSTYSGGLRQRLNLAIGMVHQPRLMLLDEPTGGLDPEGRASYWQMMQSYAHDGHAVVIATHDLDEVTRHSQRVALLSRGKVRIEGTAREIIARHGRVTLEFTLDQPPEDWQPLRQRLAAMEGIAHVELRAKQASLRLEQRPGLEGAVLAVLKQAGLKTAAYRREQPDLSSAYVHLTGQELLTDVSAPEGARPGGKRG